MRAAGPAGSTELGDGRSFERWVVPDELYIETLGDVARLLVGLSGEHGQASLDWSEQHKGHDECSPPLWPNHRDGAGWREGVSPDRVGFVAECDVVGIDQDSWCVVYRVGDVREVCD